MKNSPRHLAFSIGILLLLNLFLGVQILYAQEQAAPTQQQGNPLGEDPGPVYTGVVREWAAATNFAKNSADIAIGKLKLDMERDPKLKKIMTRELLADLSQYFYELFISAQTMTDLARIYSQYFTIDEMQEMIRFYKSPVGQKLVKASPELTIKTQQISMDLLKKNEKSYMALIAKHLGIKTPEPAKTQ